MNWFIHWSMSIQSNIFSCWPVGYCSLYNPIFFSSCPVGRWVTVHYTIQYVFLLAGGPVGYYSLYNPIFVPIGRWAGGLLFSIQSNICSCWPVGQWVTVHYTIQYVFLLAGGRCPPRYLLRTRNPSMICASRSGDGTLLSWPHACVSFV